MANGTDTSIAWQNKDIVAKLFGERMRGKPLSLFGLETAHKVTGVQPTNIPIVAARELRMDNLFELDDGSIAILDYESGYEEKNFYKYGRYIMNVGERYLGEGKRPDIHMMVIYTADIANAPSVFHKAACDIRVEAVHLSRLDSEAWKSEIEEGLAAQSVTDEMVMHLVLLPLTYAGMDAKQAIIEECVRMARQISDKEKQAFVLAGLLAFTDKVISPRTRTNIKEALAMTQVGKMLMDEGRIEGIKEVALEMLRDGEPIEKIIRYTGLKKDEIMALQEQACALV